MTPANFPASFGAWVRARRRQLDLTQAGLGKCVGCSEAAIRKIEADERKPSRELAELLARALEIHAAEHDVFLQMARGVFLAEVRPAASPKSATNLPALLTSTINRARDLQAVTSLLTRPDVRLVTLIGPPGIGKTRLSIHAGGALSAEFSDGIWFVDLAEVFNPDFFIPTLARSILPLSLPPSPELLQLLSGLRDKTTLLILDNFEQIVEKAALDVAQILKTCPQVKILVTSRVPLHIYGEHEYVLPPLSIPPRGLERTPAALLQFESVQLFTARVRQHQPHFEISPQNAALIIEFCAILEGIPLALELAAASLRQMTLDEMAALLRGQGWVSQLATPARDLPPRQRTLENVIAWSYTLLNERQKEGFARLGVFSQWFDAEAAAAICELDSVAAAGLLTALEQHSLLVCESFDGKKYWRMLELIHAFAGSRLTQPQRAQVELLRARYYLRRLADVQKKPTEKEHFFQFHANNLWSALQWAIEACQVELAYSLAGFLDEDYWGKHGYFREGLALLRGLLELPCEESPSLRANRLQMASDFAWQQHDFETALRYCREAANLGRIHHLKREYPWHLNRLGRIYLEQGRYAEAAQALQEGLDLAYREPDIMNPGVPLAQLGEMVFFQGKLDECRALLEKALAYLEHDADIFLAMALTDLAEIALAKKEFEKAQTLLRRAFQPARSQARRLAVFLLALVGYLVSSPGGDKEKAVGFLGALASLGESSGVVFSQFYIDLSERRSQVARAQLASNDWDGKFREGRQWRRAELLAQIELVLQPLKE